MIPIQVADSNRLKISQSSGWLANHLDLHFRTLGLAKLYAAEAADELLNFRHQLQIIHAAGGAGMVRAESSRVIRLNGWCTVTFEAFAENAWYCGGGFR
jgi:hypothetical protein